MQSWRMENRKNVKLDLFYSIKLVLDKDTLLK